MIILETYKFLCVLCENLRLTVNFSIHLKGREEGARNV